MNRPHLTLVRTGELERRALATIVDELGALCFDLETLGPAIEPHGPVAHGLVMLHEAREMLRTILPPPLADVAAKLAALDELCAHCGHDAGSHLVEAPHACEFAADFEREGLPYLPELEPCGCAGFVPPGRFARDTVHDMPTDRAPAPAGEAL